MENNAGTYNLPEMTEAEWDAHCAQVAAAQLAIWQAKQARKTSVIQMLNVGIRPCVAVYTVTGHSNNGTGQALQEVAQLRAQFGTEQEAKWFVKSQQLYGTRKNVVFDISVKAVA